MTDREGQFLRRYCLNLRSALNHAMARLVDNARAKGANAITMMRFDSSELGQTMSEIVAYGTAVVIEPVQ